MITLFVFYHFNGKLRRSTFHNIHSKGYHIFSFKRDSNRGYQLYTNVGIFKSRNVSETVYIHPKNIVKNRVNTA